MKYFSMFSGIGGFELGIEKAYEEKSRNRKITQTDRDMSNIDSRNVWWWGNEQSPTCVGYSEIDKYASAIYDYHFNHTNYGDCTKINWQEVEDFDLLTAGFPCQAFSLAGKRLGFKDTRGTLFFEIARCLKEKRPKYFLLENVKGLLSHDHGNTFKTIVSTLTELGYDLQWQCLNSKCFGVPQSRPRVFIVGHLRAECRPEIFPIREGNKEDFELNSLISHTIDANYYKGPGAKDVKKHLRQLIFYTDTIRRLTPIECERLQGFDAGWTKKGIMKGKEVAISDTRRYQTLGNAVTVNVIQYIFGKILDG